MIKKSGHIHWGTYASEAALPNVNGSPNTTNDLEIGDLAYVSGDSNFQCTWAVVGSAIWSSIGSGAGTDTAAIHNNVADEFDTAFEKTSPVLDDRVLIEDSQDGLNKKYTTIENFSVGASTFHSNIDGEINGLSNVTPADSDVLLLEDSSHSYSKKKTLIENLPVIHRGQPNEISAIAEKLSPVGEDLILIEDSEASNAKKRVQVTNLSVGANAFHKTIDGEIDSLDQKVTPVNADVLLIEDSAEGAYDKKKILISALPNVTDPDAIHDNTANEIAAVASKATPVVGDYLIIEDSEDSNNKKSITLGKVPARDGIDTSAIHDDAVGEISAITLKGSPVSGDLLIIEDSDAGNAKKSITLGSLPTGDSDAIHDNVAGEINGIASEQTTLASDDLFLIEDGTTLAKKKVQATNLKDFDAVHKSGTGDIAGLTEDAAPDDADVVMVEDVSGGNVKRKVQLSNLPGSGGGGAGGLIAVNVATVMGTVAIDEIIGQTTYDGSTSGNHTFKAVVEPKASATCEIKLYDRGPVAGPATEAKLVAKLTTSTAGLQVLSESIAASASPTFPDNNEMYNTDRMYEVRAYISGSEGDVLYVGKVTLAVA